MKVLDLKITKHKHLENVHFDFTYQGGEKKGLPLEKICLIGQSATGKTNLLDLIFERSNAAQNTELIGGDVSNYYNSKFSGTFTLSINDKVFVQQNNQITYDNRAYKHAQTGGVVNDLFSGKDRRNILYFKAGLISNFNIDFFTRNPIELIEKHSGRIDNIVYSLKNGNKTGIVFDNEIDVDIWLGLLHEILEYRKNFTQKMSELIHRGLLADTKKLETEFKKWQKANPNQLVDFAEKFNPIIQKLNLEVDVVNTEFSIPIKNKFDDEAFSITDASTGTKGLLLSILPILKLDTKDSIILLDEPERSLYPDIQIELIDYYKSLAPEAQIIVATHSPFIAAAFEPDERFILYFDDEGKVSVRRGTSPVGDDPNDMLKNDFDINYVNKYGQDAYRKYLNLKEKLAQEKDREKKKKLLLEATKLGDTYKF